MRDPRFVHNYCAYCRKAFVVPSLARDHEKTCPAKPEEKAA